MFGRVSREIFTLPTSPLAGHRGPAPAGGHPAGVLSAPLTWPLGALVSIFQGPGLWRNVQLIVCLMCEVGIIFTSKLHDFVHALLFLLR